MKNILLLMLALLLFKSNFAKDFYRVETKRLNVRESSNPKSKIIGYVPFGESVEVLDSTNSSRYKIKVGNALGYVNSSFLKRTIEQNKESDVTVHNLKVLGIASLSLLLVICFYYLFRPRKNINNAYAHPYLNAGYAGQQVIVKQKSVVLAILLTLLFGPLGMFYSTIRGAITMLLLPIIGGLFFMLALIKNYQTLSFFMLVALAVFAGLYWTICIIWAAISASKSNQIIINSYY